MNKVLNARPPGWFWLVSTLLLVWNAFGVFMYVAPRLASVDQLRQSYSEAQLQMMAATPAWVTAAFAIAVFSGLLGAIGLLMRKSWARTMFMVSLIAVIVQNVWTFFLSGYLASEGAAAAILPVVIIIVCIGSVWLAGRSIARGWLR